MVKESWYYLVCKLSFSAALLFPICGSAQVMLQKTQVYIEEKQPISSFYSTALQTSHYYIQSATDKVGIFCLWEDRIIEKSRVPIHFRLGTLEYTNHLEYPSFSIQKGDSFYSLNSTPSSP